MADTTTNGRVVLNRDTLLPVGVVSAIIATLFSGYLWLQAQFQDIRGRLDRIEVQASDRWTETDMRLWVLEFARKNPQIATPDARHHAPGER